MVVVLHVVVLYDLLNVGKQARTTFILKGGEKYYCLWNDDNELLITTSCAFYFLLVRK